MTLPDVFNIKSVDKSVVFCYKVPVKVAGGDLAYLDD